MLVIKLVTQGTVEEGILKLAKAKLQLAHDVLAGISSNAVAFVGAADILSAGDGDASVVDPSDSDLARILRRDAALAASPVDSAFGEDVQPGPADKVFDLEEERRRFDVAIQDAQPVNRFRIDGELTSQDSELEAVLSRSSRVAQRSGALGCVQASPYASRCGV